MKNISVDSLVLFFVCQGQTDGSSKGNGSDMSVPTN